MAIGAQGDSVRWIKNLGKQIINGNDVMHFQSVGSAAFRILRPAPLAFEIIAMQHVRPELIVQRRVSDHEPNGLDSSAVVRVAVAGVSHLLQFSVALFAASASVLRFGWVIQPSGIAHLASQLNLGLSLRDADTFLRAVSRNVRSALGVEVRWNETNWASANCAEVFPFVFSNPGERRFCWMPNITSHTSHSTIQG